jgi:hypothetical protein
MLLRQILLFILILLVVRVLSRMAAGVLQGLSGPPTGQRGRVPSKGVHMVRDPVCGTFVVPDRALMLTDGARSVYFCSTACRDGYRARPPADSGRPEGRTA